MSAAILGDVRAVALRTYRSPDGRPVFAVTKIQAPRLRSSPVMPFVSLREMSEVDVQVLYLYLREMRAAS